MNKYLKSIFLGFVVILIVLSNWYLLTGYSSNFEDVQIYGESPSYNPQEVPSDYLDAWEYIQSNSIDYRSLWLPIYQRYRFGDQRHPHLEKDTLFGIGGLAGTLSEAIKKVDNDKYAKTLGLLNTKYIVLRLKKDRDWIFTGKDHAWYVGNLESKKGLKRIHLPDSELIFYENTFAKPRIYLVENEQILDSVPYSINDYPLDKVFNSVKTEGLKWEFIDPTKYRLTFDINEPIFVVFAEQYDSRWSLKYNGRTIKPKPVLDSINGFYIDAPFKGDAEITFDSQKYLDFSFGFFVFGLILIVLFLIFTSKACRSSVGKIIEERFCATWKNICRFIIDLFKKRPFIFKDRTTLFLLFVIFLLILIVYGGWLNFDIITRGDWKARSVNWMKDWLSVSYAWDTGDYGGVSFINAGRIVRYPLYFLQAFFSHVLNFPYAVVERLIWFFPFLIVSSVSIYLLTKKIFKNEMAGLIAIIIFLFNNFVIFRAHGAQMVLLMGYALTPLVILFFVNALREKFLKNVLLAGVVLALLVYNDVRLAVLVFALLCIYGLYILFVQRFFSSTYYAGVNVKKLVVVILGIGGVLFVLNAYWIFPMFLSHQEVALSGEGFFSLDKVAGLSRTNFWHALSMSIGNSPKSGAYVYLPGQIDTSLLFILPLFVALPLFLSKRYRKEVLFWYMIYVLFAFMAKGLNDPLAFLNKLFYENVPYASMFRLPDKFLYIMATPFAMLYGLACAEMLDLKKFFKSVKYAKILITLFFVVIPFSVIFPAVLGSDGLRLEDTKGGSSFSSVVPPQYFIMDDWLNAQDTHYKTAWVGGTPRYDFFNFLHPRFEVRTSIQENSLFGNYYMNFLNANNRNSFLPGIEYLIDVKNFDKIMGLLNIKYFILPPADDPDWFWASKDKGWDYYVDILTSNSDLGLNNIDLKEPGIKILASDDVLPKVYAPKKAMLVLGGARALDFLLDQNDFNIIDWNLYFPERLEERFDYIKDGVQTILLFGQSVDDFLLNILEAKFGIGESLSFGNYHQKLSALGELRINYRGQMKEVGKEENQIVFDKDVLSDGSYDIWARVAFSDGSYNAIELVSDYESQVVVYPEFDYPNQYRWYKISTLNLKKGKHNFALNFFAENMALDDVVFMPTVEYANNLTGWRNYLSKKQAIFVTKFKNDVLHVDYKEEFLKILFDKGIGIFDTSEPAKIDKLYSVNFVKDFQYNHLIQLIDSGDHFEYWKDENEILSHGVIDPDDSQNKYIILGKMPSFSRNLSDLDFTPYSTISIRLKENFVDDVSTEGVELFIKDVDGNQCNFSFQTSKDWKEYEFQLSECDSKDGKKLNFEAINEIGISGIYSSYKILLDYIYLSNESEFENIDLVDRIFITDLQGRQYVKELPKIFNLDKELWINSDGNYQLVFETDLDVSDDFETSIFQKGIPVKLSYVDNKVIVDSIDLVVGINKLSVAPNLVAHTKMITYFKKTANILNYSGKNGLFVANFSPIKITSWEMLNPSKYHVKAKTSSMGFINLLDSYDAGWVAKYNMRESRSVPLTTINNSFVIEPFDNEEEVDIYLEYEPQKLMDVGFVMLILGWLSIIGGLIFVLKKKK